MEKIKVIIADDHKIVIDGIRAIISDEEVEIIGEAQNGVEVLKMLSKLKSTDTKADVLILDINMPKKDGIETTREVLEQYPNTRILILTMHNNPQFIKRLAASGAHGYILKDTGKDDLLVAIRTVAEGNKYYEKSVSDILIESLHQPYEKELIKLTKREKQVLGQIDQGLKTQQIADDLFISTHTVESHRKNLLSKFGVNNSTSMLKLAREKGLI